MLRLRTLVSLLYTFLALENQADRCLYTLLFHSDGSAFGGADVFFDFSRMQARRSPQITQSVGCIAGKTVTLFSRWSFH